MPTDYTTTVTAFGQHSSLRVNILLDYKGFSYLETMAIDFSADDIIVIRMAIEIALDTVESPRDESEDHAANELIALHNRITRALGENGISEV